jgi:two-component system cell cycle sensor histidine kinase PleC
MGGETPGDGDALTYRKARVFVAVADEARRRHLVGCLAGDGYAFVFNPSDGNGSALLILAEPGEADPAWRNAPDAPRVVLLDSHEGMGDDWIAPGAPAADLRQRIRLNAEIAVLRRHLAAAAALAPEKVRKRIERLELGLRLLQDAQRHLERQLAEAREREAKRQGGLPPASVLHELKTPLNAISGFSEIMRMEVYGPLGSDKYREYVETIHQATSHLMEVVNDLMEVYSLESGQIRMRPTRTDLRGTVLSVARLLSPQADRAGINIVADFEDGPPAVETDEGRVRQVLINLVGNAIKFTPKGGKVSIRMKGELAGGAVKLQVRDSGIGISPERLPVVAHPYSRGQPGPEAPEGSGLGLSITKILVEKLGGRLGIESALGAGTEVTVTLPVKWTHRSDTVH